MTTDTLLRSLIAGHDAGGTAQRADSRDAHAEQMLARILATPRLHEAAEADAPVTAADVPAADVPAGEELAVAARPARRGSRRKASWFALAAGGVLVAGIGGGAGAVLDPPQAFANWSQRPTAISGPEVLDSAEQCLDMMRPTPGEPTEGMPTAQQFDRITPVIGDRRGNATFVVLAGGGYTATCLVNDGSGLPGLLGLSAGSMGAGLAADPADLSVPAQGLADVQRSGTGGEGTLTAPWAYESVTGHVGSEVRAVTVHTERGDVQATVAGGRFAAWWPVDVPEGSSSEEVTGRLTARDLTATLTLSDGATVEVDSLDALMRFGESAG